MDQAETQQFEDRGVAGPRDTVDDETDYLYRIIDTLGSGSDLEGVLGGIVRLCAEATGCHGCFVYFVQDGRLVLRAAPRMYRQLEGKIVLSIGEGLTGWVAETHQSAFIRDHALDDPRFVNIPELKEELFQSLVSVPILSPTGDVVGIITLHAPAPHEFSRNDLDFLEHTASLVAWAVENDRLSRQTTARVALLTKLSRVSRDLASAGSLDEVLTAAVKGCKELIGTERCEIYLLDSDQRLVLRAANPQRQPPAPLRAHQFWLEEWEPGSSLVSEGMAPPELLWGPEVSGTPILLPLDVGETRIGLFCASVAESGADVQSVFRAFASHTAFAIMHHQLAESASRERLVKEFFESLCRGGSDGRDLPDRARRIGCDLAAPYVVLHAVAWDDGPGTEASGRADRAQSVFPDQQRGDGPSARPRSEPRGWRDLASRIEAGLASELPRSMFDHGETSMRALLRVSGDGLERLHHVVERTCRAVADDTGGVLSVGLSNVCQGTKSFPQGFREAASAASVGPLIRGGHGVFDYEDLGPYRYVLASEHVVRDSYQERVRRLVDYDRQRGTDLVGTLERYLDCRGNVVRAAQALYVHPNTLRQRLLRINRVAELALDREDWLSLGIAIRIEKLRLMRPSTATHVDTQNG